MNYLRIVCSAVVAIRRAEQRPRLGPGRLLKWFATLVREKTELVTSRAAVAGRKGKEGLSVVIQRRRGLVDTKSVDLP